MANGAGRRGGSWPRRTGDHVPPGRRAHRPGCSVREFWGTRSAPGRPAAVLPADSSEAPVPDVVRPESDNKKALILSPVLWEFGIHDEGPDVADLLRDSEGYSSGVDFLQNRKKTDSEVTVESFKNWDDYDVIHLSSHGKRLCIGDACRVVIVATTLDSILPDGPGAKIDKIAASEVLRERGVGISKSSRGRH